VRQYGRLPIATACLLVNDRTEAKRRNILLYSIANWPATTGNCSICYVHDNGHVGPATIACRSLLVCPAATTATSVAEVICPINNIDYRSRFSHRNAADRPEPVLFVATSTGRPTTSLLTSNGMHCTLRGPRFPVPSADRVPHSLARSAVVDRYDARQRQDQVTRAGCKLTHSSTL